MDNELDYLSDVAVAYADTPAALGVSVARDTGTRLPLIAAYVYRNGIMPTGGIEFTETLWQKDYDNGLHAVRDMITIMLICRRWHNDVLIEAHKHSFIELFHTAARSNIVDHLARFHR